MNYTTIQKQSNDSNTKDKIRGVYTKECNYFMQKEDHFKHQRLNYWNCK